MVETTTTARIRQVLPTLSAASARLANYFLEHPDRVVEATQEDVAADLGISTATVSRFAKMIGYSSYSHLRMSLSSQIARAAGTRLADVSDTDSAMQSARKTVNASVEALRGTLDFLNGEDIEFAVSSIMGARRLGIFGLGSSNIVAQYAYHTFLRLPVEMVYSTDYHFQLMDAGKLDDADVALVISHTGNDSDMTLLAERLHDDDVPILAITSYPASPLAQLSDVHFNSVSEDTRFRTEALISVTSQIGVVDVLFTELCRRYGESAEQELEKVRRAVAVKHRG